MHAARSALRTSRRPGRYGKRLLYEAGAPQSEMPCHHGGDLSMKKMKVFLHIGWHKTGTTALQKFLHRNRHALREQCGFDYPDSGLYNVAHNLLPWSLSPARFKRANGVDLAAPAVLVEDMLREASGRGLERLIVSSESFSVLGRPQLEPLAQSLRGHEVVVVAYVRRQDRYLESVYNQIVRDDLQRCSVPFDEFLRTQLERPRLDYGVYFRRWTAIFGRPNVQVRLYDRKALCAGDIRRDFCRLVGLEADRLAFKDTEDNPSLDFESVNFLAHMNAVELPQATRDDLLRILKERAASAGPSSLLSPEQRREVVGRFREANRRFAADYLDAPDAFELRQDELAQDAQADFSYGLARFVATLAEVLPRLTGGAGR
jgi:hypothetical protein